MAYFTVIYISIFFHLSSGSFYRDTAKLKIVLQLREARLIQVL